MADIFENLNKTGNLLLIGGIAYLGYKIYQNFWGDKNVSPTVAATQGGGAYYSWDESMLGAGSTSTFKDALRIANPLTTITNPGEKLKDYFGFIQGLIPQFPQGTPKEPTSYPEQLKMQPSAVVQTMSYPQVSKSGKASFPVTKKSFYKAPSYPKGAPTKANASALQANKVNLTIPSVLWGY